MFDSFYEFLAQIGYSHPPHPPILHIPMGMMMGAFLLALAALLFRRPVLAQSARHCVFLVLIFFFPAALTGVMDWQYYFSGAWVDAITIKLVLSGALLVFLVAGIILGRRGKFGSKAVLIAYGLSVLAAGGIGYYGADLAFGEKAPEAPPEYRAGETIYIKNCGACHPYGGNIVNAKLSVTGAPELIDPGIFLAYLRDPKQPKGSIALMPIVPRDKVSDEQARQLFDYITKVLERPRRPLDPSLYPSPLSQPK
jgi:mono/diheme cytochrome c family protein